MDHSAGFLCAIGHSAEFFYVLWVIAKELVMNNGPKRPTSYHSAEVHNNILKASHILYMDNVAKKVYVYKHY
jgi:hypothetical protein